MKHFMHYVVALCLISSMSFAIDALPQRGPIGFDVHDTNKDGIISQDEFDAVKAARKQSKTEAGMPMRNADNAPDFNFFDANKDGKITPEEFQKGQAQQMQNRPRGGGRVQ